MIVQEYKQSHFKILQAKFGQTCQAPSASYFGIFQSSAQSSYISAYAVAHARARY